MTGCAEWMSIPFYAVHFEACWTGSRPRGEDSQNQFAFLLMLNRMFTPFVHMSSIPDEDWLDWHE